MAEVVREAYPDPTQFDPKSKYFDERSDRDDPRWWLVDVGFVDRFPTPVALGEVKTEASLAEMVLVNNSRLSVQPVTEKEFDRVMEISKGPSA
jgi:predicted RNA-binding protein with PUA-like domain